MQCYIRIYTYFHLSSVTICQDYHLWRRGRGGIVWKIREQRKCRTMDFDMPKHVNCSWYHIYCPFLDIVIGKFMPVRKSHTPVLFESHFRDDLLFHRVFAIDCCTWFSKYKQNNSSTVCYKPVMAVINC